MVLEAHVETVAVQHGQGELQGSPLVCLLHRLPTQKEKGNRRRDTVRVHQTSRVRRPCEVLEVDGSFKRGQSARAVLGSRGIAWL